MRMNITMKSKIKIPLLILPLAFLFYGVLGTSMHNVPEKKKLEFNYEEVLKRHNYYRKKLDIPPLQWSEELADYAQNWANSLVSNGCGLVHSKGPYGENIYWTTGKFSESATVDYWADEEKYFNHDSRIIRKNNWYKTGHYTQIIWRNTKYVGAGIAQCSNGDIIFVCSYDPPGNYIGDEVY